MALPKFSVDTLSAEAPLGRHLILVFRQFEDHLLVQLGKSGIRDITPGDLNVLRFVSPEGSQAIQIAKLASISKQAIGKSLGRLESRGYVILRPDPNDGRSLRVTFSKKGERVIGRAIEIIRDIEAAYARALGAENLAQIKTWLQTLHTLQASWLKAETRAARRNASIPPGRKSEAAG